MKIRTSYVIVDSCASLIMDFSRAEILVRMIPRNVETDYKKRITANTTMNKIYDDPLLIYNFESFLFQMKSCLDGFSQLLAYSFKLESTTYTKFGDDLVKMFQKKLQKESRRK
jgi:hypothetical protein